MAEPCWTSKDDPAYTVDGTVVTANPGNWQQGKAFPAERLNEPRYVYVWTVNGGIAGGWPPPKSSLPATRFAGETLLSLDFAAYGPGTHKITFRVYAGTHSVYAGAYDVYEWGTGNVVTGEPYVVELELVIPAAEPPPPPPPSKEVTLGSATQAALAALYEYVEVLRARGIPDSKIAPTFVYQLVRALSLPYNDPRRAAVRDAIRKALDG